MDDVLFKARRGQLDELRAEEEAEKHRREEAEALAQVRVAQIHYIEENNSETL